MKFKEATLSELLFQLLIAFSVLFTLIITLAFFLFNEVSYGTFVALFGVLGVVSFFVVFINNIEDGGLN